MAKEKVEVKFPEVTGSVQQPEGPEVARRKNNAHWDSRTNLGKGKAAFVEHGEHNG